MRENKLFADIKCINGKYMFLHPTEVAAALGMPKQVRSMGFAAPDDFTEAFRLLGNMYVPFQSGQAWIKIYHLLSPEPLALSMNEIGLLWKTLMIDFSVCRTVHIEDEFIIAEIVSEEEDRRVPTQKFACWKGTSRLVYDASLEDEALHKQMFL